MTTKAKQATRKLQIESTNGRFMADLIGWLDKYPNGKGTTIRIPDEATAATERQLTADLLAACKAALAVIPGLEVHNWPPGHAMKREAIELLRAAIAKAERKE